MRTSLLCFSPNHLGTENSPGPFIHQFTNSLLQVPASINRVYALVHPTELSFPLNYSAGLVLPLMGFWNSVIYITTSWAAVKTLFPQTSIFSRTTAEVHGLARKSMSHARTGSAATRGMGRSRTLSSGEISREYGLGVAMPIAQKKSRGSLSDSMKGLAG